MDDERARNKILGSTYELLSQMPYQKMSLEMVARRAGVSKALVLYHFGSKRELTRRALMHGFAGAMDSLAFEGDLDDGAVRDILPMLVDFTYESMYLFVSFMEVVDMESHADDELAVAMRDMYALFTGKLTRFLEAKGDPYPHEKAMLLALAVDMIGMVHHVEGTPPDIERYVGAILDILHVEAVS